MNQADFTALVAEMRRAQKEYFRTRSATALTDSKRLEKRVDEALVALSTTQRQGSLFTEPGD